MRRDNQEMGVVSEKEPFIQHCFYFNVSKERAGTRRLIENQLKVTGGSNEDNMYKIFFFFFFFIFTFFPATNVQNGKAGPLKLLYHCLYFPIGSICCNVTADPGRSTAIVQL